MNLKQFTFKLRHDRGTVKVMTVASSEEAARVIICNAELCPDRAVTLIKVRELMTKH